MAPKELPTAEELSKLFEYRSDTGKFYYRATGKEAFISESRGYRRCNVETREGRRFLFAHRVAWKMAHGEEPVHVDHINGVRSDNRIVNLRSVDQQANNRNMKARLNTAYLGLMQYANGRWRARIKVDFRYLHLGVFATFDEAFEARKAAEKKFGFHENHGRNAQ